MCIKTTAISFLIGVVVFQFNQELPPTQIFVVLPIALVLFIIYPRLRPALIAVLGFYWAYIFALMLLHPRLDETLDNQLISISGNVMQITRQHHAYQQIIFEVDHSSSLQRLPNKVQLAWYHGDSVLNLHSHCQLVVRLKHFYRYANPGVFDYEKMMFVRGIRARGTIKHARCTVADNTFNLRTHLIERFAVQYQQLESFGLIQALTYGERKYLSAQQWEIFRLTGTAHLMAISGLHVSVISMFSFFLIRQLVTQSARLCNIFPAHHYAALGTILIAFFYAYLAGYSLPTQRALVMVLTVLVATLLHKPSMSLNGFAVALLCILILSPVAVLTVGFWYSFMSVLFIFIALKLFSQGNKVKKFLLIQIYLSAALLPLSLLIFKQGALISPLANLIAIPFVSIIILPLNLCAQLLFILDLALASYAIDLLNVLLNIMLSILAHLAGAQINTIDYHAGLVAVVLCQLGLYFLIQKRGYPGRYLAAVLIAAIVCLRTDDLREHELMLTVLDVGQGLSVVIETAQHVLIYDTGMSSASGFSISDSVLKPFLAHRNIKQIDRLIISHNDNDHAGGLQQLLASTPVKQLILSEPVEHHINTHLTYCQREMSWVWGQVKFDVLHPPPAWQSDSNNRSCVLRVTHPNGSVLLTGDIEHQVETLLVTAYGEQLRSDVLIVPHHGSRSSSSVEFLSTVQATYAIVSAGIANRYGHPHQQVMNRYTDADTQVLTTARSGAIRFKIDHAGIHALQAYADASKRYWHSARNTL